MAIGDYRVKGHASLAPLHPSAGSASRYSGSSRSRYRRLRPRRTVNMEKNEKDFHDNVKDAYFGVNSAKITPDTLATIIHAAQYLVAHPAIQVIISGWADPRGSVDYNLALACETRQCCSRCPDRRRSASKPTRNHQQRQVEPGVHDQGPGMLETESPRFVQHEAVSELQKWAGEGVCVGKVRYTAGPSASAPTLLMTELRRPRFGAAPTALRSSSEYFPALTGWADVWRSALPASHPCRFYVISLLTCDRQVRSTG